MQPASNEGLEEHSIHIPCTMLQPLRINESSVPCSTLCERHTIVCTANLLSHKIALGLASRDVEEHSNRNSMHACMPIQNDDGIKQRRGADQEGNPQLSR